MRNNKPQQKNQATVLKGALQDARSKLAAGFRAENKSSTATTTPTDEDQTVREGKTADSILLSRINTRITEIVQKVSDFKIPTDD